tara:strand:+ start:512 stop:2446 length:1935 start_codon:yes stop_codon:yes gene_type:complete
MANIRKSFNFRNGVQVDEDNLIVNSNGLVGIGTSIPGEVLDVRGTLQVVGVATLRDTFIGVATVQNKLSVGIVSITEDGYIQASSGIVTFSGDGSALTNIPTSQWTDIDAGLGYTSIYNIGNVGVQTVDPRFALQIGGNSDVTQVGFSSGVGINSVGDILATGIMTARTYFGQGNNITELDADNISAGTVANDRLPDQINKPTGVATFSSFVGTLTGNVVGDITGTITGIADTARGLTGTPDITVGIETATGLNVTNFANVGLALTVGIATAHNELHVGTGGTALSVLIGGKLGIGSAIPESELTIRKASGSLAQIISNQGQARLSIGQQVGAAASTGVLRYGSSGRDFEILNNTVGNLNSYVHAGSAGINTGNFNWIYGQTNAERMTLTYDGKLGIGKTDPNATFEVVGTSTFTSDVRMLGGLTVDGGITGSVTMPGTFDGNVNTLTGVSTFFSADFGGTVSVGSSVGIGTTVPITDLDMRTAKGFIERLGVGTDKGMNGDAELAETLEVSGTAIVSTSIGIGTTSTEDLATGDVFFDEAAALRVVDGNINFHTGEMKIVSSTIIADRNSTIGIGTTNAQGAIDFSDAGRDLGNGSSCFMIVPRNTNAQRTGLITATGAIIFNTDVGRFQGYTGIAWTDFHGV